MVPLFSESNAMANDALVVEGSHCGSNCWTKQRRYPGLLAFMAESAASYVAVINNNRNRFAVKSD